MSESSVVQEMREALLKIKSLFRDIDLSKDTPEGEAYALADSALDLPLRNCDVGTAKDQYDRMRIWFRDHTDPYGWSDERALKWAQLPYEIKAADGN